MVSPGAIIDTFTNVQQSIIVKPHVNVVSDCTCMFDFDRYTFITMHAGARSQIEYLITESTFSIFHYSILTCITVNVNWCLGIGIVESIQD